MKKELKIVCLALMIISSCRDESDGGNRTEFVYSDSVTLNYSKVDYSVMLMRKMGVRKVWELDVDSNLNEFKVTLGWLDGINITKRYDDEFRLISTTWKYAGETYAETNFSNEIGTYSFTYYPNVLEWSKFYKPKIEAHHGMDGKIMVIKSEVLPIQMIIPTPRHPFKLEGDFPNNQWIIRLDSGVFDTTYVDYFIDFVGEEKQFKGTFRVAW